MLFMNIKEIICDALAPYHVDTFGVCRFDDIKKKVHRRSVDSGLPENPCAVIVMLFPYYLPVSGAVNVARYAMPDDYHNVVGGILEEAANILRKNYPDEVFAPFVDKSPIHEKEAARLAGLGVIGRNGLLINPKYGAYAFIGTIITGLDIPAERVNPGACLGCDLCIRSCPTLAISSDGSFDPARCLSAITQKKQTLSEWEEKMLRGHNLIWGCDTCLDRCPMNQSVAESPISAFRGSMSPLITPNNIDNLWDLKIYNYRPKSVLLRNYSFISKDVL